MNLYLIIIVFALVIEFLIRSCVRYLNLTAMDPDLPSEFDGFYQPQEYQRSQRYTQAKTKLSYVSSSISLLVILALILADGFNFWTIMLEGLVYLLFQPACFFLACFF